MNESAKGGGGYDDAALEDAKAFNKGKGPLLAAMVATVLAVLGGAGWYLAQDHTDHYGELGKQVNGLRTQYFDGFLVCALPGKKVSEIKSDEQLRAELHGRGAAGARYGAHLRGACSAPLRELTTRLRALLPTADSAPFVNAMVDGATKMREGVEAYAGHLDALSGAYDKAAAEPELEQLIRGWYEFRKAHAEFNRLVKEKRDS